MQYLTDSSDVGVLVEGVESALAVFENATAFSDTPPPTPSVWTTGTAPRRTGGGSFCGSLVTFSTWWTTRWDGGTTPVIGTHS